MVSYLSVKKKVVNTVEEKIILSKEVLFEELKPIFLIFMVYGVFPVSRSSPGNNQFQLLSWPMAYSLIIYAIIIGTEIVYTVLFQDYFKALSLKSMTTILLVIMAMIFHIIMIPCHCFEAPKLAHYLNEWWKFQYSYFKVLGMELKPKLFSTSLGYVVRTVISGISLTILSTYFQNLLFYDLRSTVSFMTAAYSTIFAHSHIIMWCMLCRMISHSAGKVKDSFEKAIQKNNHPEDVINQYMRLWFELLKITRDTGYTFCYSMGFIITVWFMTLLCGIYSFFMGLLKYHMSLEEKLFYLLHSLFCFCLLFIFCWYPYKASFQVSSAFKDTISKLMSCENKLLKEKLHTFLQLTVANSSDITLNGYLTANRSLLVTIVSTILTHLVVMLQFSSSDSEESVIYESSIITTYASVLNITNMYITENFNEI